MNGDFLCRKYGKLMKIEASHFRKNKKSVLFLVGFYLGFWGCTSVQFQGSQPSKRLELRLLLSVPNGSGD